MHIKSIVSAATLAIALGFAGSAAAQTMIGDQTISEGDLERVKVHCEDLQNKANAADPGSEDAEEGAEEGVEEGNAGLVKLDEVTLEQCLEAGLIVE